LIGDQLKAIPSVPHFFSSIGIGAVGPNSNNDSHKQGEHDKVNKESQDVDGTDTRAEPVDGGKE
jgi:hypothetical protein